MLFFVTCRLSLACRRTGFCSPSTASAIRISWRAGPGPISISCGGHFAARPESLGYEVIDLDPDFFRHYAAHAQRFEYPHDGHWNETGHAVAAEAVLASKLVERLIGQQPGP